MPEQLTELELSQIETRIARCESLRSMVPMTPREARALLDQCVQPLLDRVAIAQRQRTEMERERDDARKAIADAIRQRDEAQKRLEIELSRHTSRHHQQFILGA